MTNSESKLPSEIALANLIEKLRLDSSLPATIKAAVLEDLSADNPSELSRLKAVVTVEEDKNEDLSTKR